MMTGHKIVAQNLGGTVIISALAILLGVTIGNFLYQARTGKDWEKALVISEHQAVALILLVIADSIFT